MQTCLGPPFANGVQTKTLGCGIKELPVSRTPWHLLTPYFSPGDNLFKNNFNKQLRVFHAKSTFHNFLQENPAMQHHFQGPKHGSSHMYQSFCHQWWCHQTGTANNLASGPHDIVSSSSSARQREHASKDFWATWNIFGSNLAPTKACGRNEYLHLSISLSLYIYLAYLNM